MSIQAECREAMNRLAARGGMFTEHDVVDAASMPNWLPRQRSIAARKAYTVLQSDYRRGRVARYGPVDIDGMLDYARHNGKIIYAHAEKGPATLETPNGVFQRLLSRDDRISSVGRRPGVDGRDDLTAWDQQGEHVPPRESAENGHSDEYSEATLDRLADLLTPRVVEKVAATLTAVTTE